MLLARDFIIWALASVFFFTGQQAGARQCFGRTTYLSSGTNGSFTSPGFPHQYTDNENCNWRITAPSGQRVLLYFTSFQLEGASCHYDSVSIYDGPSSLYPLLAKKCGSDIPAPIYSSGREMFVNFRSDSSGWYPGFKAKYLSLSNSTACSSINYNDSTGVVFSPGFPWSYPNNKRCYWYITAPYGMAINLTFTTFDLQPPRFSPCSDYVMVTNVYGYYNSRRICGNHVPLTVRSSRRYLQISFRSNSYDHSYKGFMAFYQTEVGPTTPRPYTQPWWRSTTYWPYYTTRNPSPVASYGCALNSNNVLRVDGSSSIASPAYPGRVPYRYYTYSSSTCTWRITTTDKNYLELTFDQMSISRCGTSCYCGNVKVYEGTSASGRLLGTFCAGKTSKVTSKENAMFVTYYASGSRDIFKATIRAHGKASVPPVPAIVVPLVVGVLLFGVIFAVIKCTKIIPSTGQAGSSNVYEVPLQTLPPSGDSVPPQYSPEHPQGITNMEFVANEGTEPA